MHLAIGRKLFLWEQNLYLFFFLFLFLVVKFICYLLHNHISSDFSNVLCKIQFHQPYPVMGEVIATCQIVCDGVGVWMESGNPEILYEG